MPWFLVRFRRYETTLEGKRGRQIESWEDSIEVPDVSSAIEEAGERATNAAGEDEEVHFDLESSEVGPADVAACRVSRRRLAERAHAR